MSDDPATHAVAHAELVVGGDITHDAATDDATALVLAGLAVDTLQSLRDFATQHDWDVTGLRCTVRLIPDDAGDICERVLSLDGALAEAHRARLLDLAGRTPVTKLLQSNVAVVNAFS